MEKNKLIASISRVFLVAGIVTLFALAVLGVIKLVPKATSSLASVFSSLRSSLFLPKETIIISLSNNSVSTGEGVGVSFEHKNKTADGTYSFRFDCDSKKLSMVVVDTSGQVDLPCKETTQIKSTSFKIFPHLKDKNTFIDSSIYIDFTPKDKTKVETTGKTILTVRNGTLKGEAQAATSTMISFSSSTPPQNNNKEVVKSNSTDSTNIVRKTDLYIKTKDSGIFVNNVFVTKVNFQAHESPVIRFDIGNDGNIPTGPWKFNAVLPTNPGEIFSSPIQPSLAPGEIIEYTLTLANLASAGNNIVSINVDPDHIVNELSETNNVVLMTLVREGVSTVQTTKADLVGRIVAIGFIDKTTGQFWQSNQIPQSARAAVQFEIENIGGIPSGDFVYTSNFSTNNYYTSPAQPSLAPGEKRQYSISFNYPGNIGSNTIIINIDSNNSVNEVSENNNTITGTVSVY